MDFTIADRLVELRLERGYSQESLAEQLGITRQAVSRWERGESLPDTDNLIALADLYGVTLDELVRPQEQAQAPEPEPESEPEFEPEPEPEVGSAQETAEVSELLPNEEPEATMSAEPERTIARPVAPDVPVAPAVEPAPVEDEGPHPLGCLLKALACLVAAFLIMSVLIASLGLLFGIRGGLRQEQVSEQGRLISNEVTVDPNVVHDMRIDWAAGPVEVVVVTDETEVTITEEYSTEELAEHPMKVDVAHGELSIDYGGDLLGSVTQVFDGRGKRLTVRLPQEVAEALGSVQCEIASDELRLSGVTCDSLRIDLASGETWVEDVTAAKLDLDVGSGEATVAGTFKDKVDADVASGKVTLTPTVVPNATKIDVTSGDVVIRLPKEASFTSRVSVTSGDFDLEFDAKKKGDTYVVGAGEGSVDVDLTSGTVCIAKQ